MTDFAHPFEVLARGPYTFEGVSEHVHPIAGYDLEGKPIPFEGFRAGGSCDYCSSPIRWAYKFRGSDNKTFKVGCDCALKGHAHDAKSLEAVRLALKEARRVFEFEKRSSESRAAKAAREAEEKAINEKAGRGAYTHAELEQMEIDREAEEARAAEERREAIESARREASEYIGSLDDRITVEGELIFRHSFESYYGVKTIQKFATKQGTVVYMGSSPLPVRVGERALFTGTVKEHSVYQATSHNLTPEKQTKLARVTVKSITASPDASRVGTKGR